MEVNAPSLCKKLVAIALIALVVGNQRNPSRITTKSSKYSTGGCSETLHTAAPGKETNKPQIKKTARKQSSCKHTAKLTTKPTSHQSHTPNKIGRIVEFILYSTCALHYCYVELPCNIIPYCMGKYTCAVEP